LKNFFNKVAGIFRGDPNKIQDTGYTRLQKAIVQNDLASVVALIKAGADVNLRGNLMYPPLHLALDKDRHTIAVALIQGGADVNLADAGGKTPLHRAVMQSQETFVRTLLKLGADPNLKDETGKTPLHVVATAQPDLVDILVKANANANAQDKDGNTPLHLFLARPVMVEHLLKNGADPNLKNDFGVSPYMMMLEEERMRDYPKVLQQMLAFKADVGSTNQLGETILHMAARLELGDTFNNVLPNCEICARDVNGNNVLHALARTQNAEMIAKVIKIAPQLLKDVNAAGRTPLGDLVRRADRPPYRIDDKYAAAAHIMIDAGADPSAKDERGRTLLHYAVEQNQLGLVEYLMSKGIDADIRDKDGKAALHLAIEKKNLTALDRLLDLGADPDLTDNRGWTVLDRLAEKEDRDSSFVQRLIVAGGQYKKQLPLNPELMRKSRSGLDKGRLGGSTGTSFGLDKGGPKPPTP
jgi:ankyrin repeat protein